MRTLALLVALACSVRAGVQEDEEFLSDMCTQDNTLQWCSQAVTAANYCNILNGAVQCDDNLVIQLLAINDYNGPVPASVGETTMREIQFNNCDITMFADELGDMPELDRIFITGSTIPPLPSFAGQYAGLEELIVLESTVNGPFPQAIIEAEALQVLSVQSTTWNTPLPAGLANSPLIKFQISLSSFTGALPVFGASHSIDDYIVVGCPSLTEFNDPDLLHGDKLEIFELGDNELMQGQIPPSLGSTLTLRIFRVYRMPLFQGPLPPTVRYAQGLIKFVLGRLDYTAPFPEELCELTDLEQFIVDDVFVGRIPHCLRRLRRVIDFGISGSGKLNCDETQNVVGSLPQFVADVMLRGLAEFQPNPASPQLSLTIRNTCLNGTIPSLSAPREFEPTFSLTRANVEISGNQFVSPYPNWIRLLLVNPDFEIPDNRCTLENNFFCDKPVPLTIDNAQCTITLDGTANVCGKCNEPDEACEDCKGVLNGPARVDRCGVCGGTNACVDCAGVVNGTAVYDACDTCNGDNSTCFDCEGVFNGTARYDLCGVCNGDSGSCLDCSGVPFGSFEYDACDVCGGQGLHCTDCEGVMDGPKELDVCNECVDVHSPLYKPSCVDCEGVPFGTKVRDRCHVCGGDGSSCDDARQVLAAQLALDRYGWLVVVPVVLLVLLCAVLVVAAIMSGDFGGTTPRRRPRAVRVARPPTTSAAAAGSRIPDLPGMRRR